MKSKSEI